MKKYLRFVPLIFASLACLPLIFFGAVITAAEVRTGEVPEGLEKSDWQSIRAAHGAWQHAFRVGDGKWQASNPGQQWTTSFDGRGFIAKPDAAAWNWGLRLRSYGFSKNPQTISGTPEIKASGERLSYHWQNGPEEWFVNDQRGLEHGFILPERPQGASPDESLTFTLSTLGTLHPVVSENAQTVHFRDEGGIIILNYSGLKVWDADGVVLDSRFEGASQGEFRIVIDERDARYPITIDPVAQQPFLKATNIPQNASDQFGYSVAVSGDTVVIGALREDSSTTGVDSIPDENASASGAAYVFVRSGTTWSQQAYLKASNAGSGDLFGTSVAVSGDTVVVGATNESTNGSVSGAAYVFVRSGTTWSEQAFLKASNSGTGDRFGISVGVSGETVVVGADNEDSSATGVNATPDNDTGNSGAAYVFVRSGTTWSQQAFLKASNTDTDDEFGTSVAISGSTVVVGASREGSSTTGANSTPNEDALNAGAAYVFVRNGSSWSEEAYLKASNSGLGDFFGTSVAVSGETVVVGAINEDSSTTGVNSTSNGSSANSGAAYVFVRNGITWSEEAYLKASNTGTFDRFGISVAISGDTVVVGAEDEGSSTTGVNSLSNEDAASSGAAYVFVRSGVTWSEEAYLKASNTGVNDNFGFSVAASGDTVMVGSFREDSSTTGVNSTSNEGNLDSGAAYIFVRDSATWSQQAYVKTPNLAGSNDLFGQSVAVSGDTVVVGATGEDSATTGVNGISNEGALNSGAAYVFVRDGGIWSQQAYLKASNTGATDQFGISVAVSGDTLVVGALNEASSTTVVNGTSDELAPSSGAAYVFVRSGTTWSQQAFLKASNTGANDLFGYSVGVAGDTVVVGAFEEDGSTTGVNGTNDDGLQNSGAAYVFVRNGTTWAEQAYLKASNTGADDQFGISVAVNGDTVLVGAALEDGNTTGVDGIDNDSANNSGAAYVFHRNGATWSQQAFLKASNTGENDLFGISVAVDGDTVVVGAKEEDSSTTGVNGTPNEDATYSGAAYVFVRSGTAWNQQAFLKASNTGAGDNFGYSVAVSEDTVVVGAYLEDSDTTGVNGSQNDNALDSGATYVFVRSGTNWSQQAFLKAANTGASDQFGQSVAVSGGTVLVGASKEDSSTTGVDGTPDENSSNSGAAYVFTDYLPPNQPPVALADFTIINAAAGTVTLDASDSSDSDGTIVSYEWEWGDGESATGEITSGTFFYGETTVFLTITDDDGATADTTITVNIPAPEYEITTADGKVTITNYNGAGGAVVIPQMFGGNPVTVIGGSAFSGKDTITSVVIPEGVTSIESFAFSGCSELADVSLPNSLISLGNDAFSACSELTEIILPPNLESIGNSAFFFCSKLTSIVIPDKVTSIGNGAFRVCTALANVVIPESVTTIGTSAFQTCSALTSVVLPSGLTVIETNAFRDCTALESIVIPANVTAIKSGAFRSCTSLKIALFKGNAPSTQSFEFFDTASEFNVVFSETSTGFTTPTWKGYPSSEEIPVAITGQPANKAIFENTTATLNVSVTGNPAPTLQWYLGNSGDLSSPIQGATNTSYTTPALTTTTSYWVQVTAFSGAVLNSDTATVTVSPEPPPEFVFTSFDGVVTITGYNGAGGAVTIPAMLGGEQVKFIGDYAFQNNSDITSVVVPEGVAEIRVGAFSGCSKMTSISLPDSLQSIGANAFYVCGDLQTINFPPNLENIGDFAFFNCVDLTSIVLPDSVMSIGSSAFRSCSGLLSIVLPSGLEAIEGSTLRSCSALQSIVIPASVNSIAANAFRSCSSLESMFFLGDAPAEGGAGVLGAASNFTVYFLTGSTGFTTPTWNGYPSTEVADATPQPPVFISEPQDQTIAAGSTNLTAVASGIPNPTYQWYSGISGDVSSPVSGETSPTFTTPSLSDDTQYWVRATNSEGTADSRTVTVTIAPPSKLLSNLTISSGTLSPGFNRLTTAYTSDVSSTTASVTVTPTAEFAGASITVNTAAVASGAASAPIALSPGNNLIEIVVTVDSSTKTYTIDITRAEEPILTTNSATDATSSSVVLRGTVNPKGTASVYFEYGSTTAYGNTTPSKIVSGNSTLPFQSAVSGLPSGATIHYRAVANGGTVLGSDFTATTLSPSPIVATGNPVVTSTSTATLVGAVNTRGQQVDVHFEYGTTTAFGNSTPIVTLSAGSGVQDVLEDVTGLIPNATYYVRLVAETTATFPGDTVQFQVTVVDGSGTGSPTAVPSVTTATAVDVQDESATLKGTVNSNGGTTTAYFEYGTTTAYGQSTEFLAVGNDTLDAEVSLPVENLLPGTRYYYRIMAQNSLGLSTPDAGLSFDTAFATPIVTTGDAEALTTTSAMLSGTVRARNADTTVEILFGTNASSLSNGATATPGLVTGDTETTVTAEIDNLLQSATYYYQVRAENSGGTTLGTIQSFKPENISGRLQNFPASLLSTDHEGILQVNLAPSAAGGGWRLEGEQEWRLSGTGISGLTSGDRVVEYRAISGYIAPSSETVAIVSGDPVHVLNRTYTASGATGSGGLTVVLKPDSFADAARPVATRAQWRLLGETDGDWKDSGVEVTGLPPGNHVIESKPIDGRATPPPASVLVSDAVTTSATLTYFEADPEVGDLPNVLSFNDISAGGGLPYTAFVGQIRSDLGSSTGFVVRPRVVATVAHAVFDDGTLASVTGLQWLFGRHRDVYEPTPLIPRGFYTMTGYAAQRETDNSPGISTPESQHLDAAAMFFAENAGRGGFGGYLASDLDDNEFLTSSDLKVLVGYPVDGVSANNLNRMYATTPADITFTLPPEQTRTFTTTDIRSVGGNSGGPICVLSPNGKFYPAAIYLGGTGQTVVRAIDSEVSALFGFAEVSGDSASGSGSGTITDTQTSPVGTPALGSLKVVIEPAGARSAGASWRIGTGAYLASGTQLDDLDPNSYGIQFSSVSGFEAPATPSVDIVAGELKTVTFTYEILVPPPVINSPAQILVNKNDDLLYQITATNSPDMFTLSGLLPLGTVFDPATGRVTGVPQETGKFPVTVGVSNSGGTDTKVVNIFSLPLISPQSVNAPYQEAFSYQIVSSEDGDGASFSLTNIPPGLLLDTTTGLVTGTPTEPGTYESTVTVSRMDAGESSTLTFEITGTSPGITTQPIADLTIEYAGNVVLTIATDGLPAPSVQWYRGTSGDVSQPIFGATGTTHVSGALTSSTNFWARLTNLSGTVDSNTSAVTVLPSTNANLAFLGLNPGSFSPSFNPGRTTYTSDLPNSVASIRLTPNTAVPVSTVTINGSASPIDQQSAPIALAVGNNVFILRVTAQDGMTTKDYMLTINRAPAPVVTTLGWDGIDDIMATVHGTVNPMGSGVVSFVYGQTTSYGSRTAFQPVSGNSELPVSAIIRGLSGDTTYHYRVGFSDGGATVFGDDMTFTTAAARPLVVTGGAAAISETGATLIGIVNPRGSATLVLFEYGTDPAVLGTSTGLQNIGSGSSVVEVTQAITGLIDGTTYYYRTVAASQAFAQPVEGEIFQFTAEATTSTGDGLADSAPEIISSSEIATDILADSAVLEATINPNDGSTLVYFEYGTTTSYGFQSDAFRIGNGTQNAVATVQIENLESGVTYFFRTVAENAKGVVTGTGSSFTTTFPGPVVTTGQAAGISTRSARVNGTVQPNGATRDVYFKYGTDGITFPQSVRAFQQTASGSDETPVYVDLVNLDEGVTYFYKIVATDVGEADGTDGEVLPLNPSFLVGFLRQESRDIPLSERQNQLTVNLVPDGIGSWRFSGEQAWRASGETADALAAGDRNIEFRPVEGYIQPPTELVGFVDGDPAQVLERPYYQSATVGTGSLQVNLVPAALADLSIPEPDRAQWRLAGIPGASRKNSGETITSLMPGTYLIECKAISGWDEPVLASATVTAGSNTPVTVTYFQETTPLTTAPDSLTFDTVTGNPDLPYSYVGQIRSNLASHSGFVVKPRVVATIAQAVFDEATLSTVGGLEWLLQRDSTTHEPKPIAPRGTYVFTGYDAQRTTENTPGTLALASQELNVAALYFFEDVGRGGFSGFLASDETANEFLASSDPKILAGYPVDQGNMHATAPDTSTLTQVQGKVFSSSVISGLGGMTGGPLAVQYEGGAYYPAGIYVGGTSQTLVRAIDSEVVALFTRAEVSGNGGENNTGGGITHTSVAGNLNATQAGALKVIIEPSTANTMGAAWQLNPESSLRLSESQKNGLTAGTYDLNFTPVDGFFIPATESATVTGGQLTTITFTYVAGASAIDTWRYENFGTYAATGDAADDQDPDNDGAKNSDEFTTGTDPNNGSDVFKITDPTKSGNTFTAGCSGKAGRTYTLQRNTALEGTWADVDSEGPLASDAAVSLTDSAAPADTSFYRIQVWMP